MHAGGGRLACDVVSVTHQLSTVSSDVSQVGNILEIVGAFGAVNLVGRNLLFAKDREKASKGLR